MSNFFNKNIFFITCVHVKAETNIDISQLMLFRLMKNINAGYEFDDHAAHLNLNGSEVADGEHIFAKSRLAFYQAVMKNSDCCNKTKS